MTEKRAPYDLALVRDALGQGGIEEGLKLSKGLRVGDVGMPAQNGDVWIEKSIRYSTALSAGVSSSSFWVPVSAAWTPIVFDAEVWDDDDCADLAAFNTRLTVNTAGVYSIYGYLKYNADVNGYRGANVRLNGGSGLGAQFVNAVAVVGAGTFLTINVVWQLDEGDYLELCAMHNLAYNLGLVNTLFSMARIA